MVCQNIVLNPFGKKSDAYFGGGGEINTPKYLLLSNFNNSFKIISELLGKSAVIHRKLVGNSLYSFKPVNFSY